MENILRETLQASHVLVVDISGGCGSMYNIRVVSPLFEGIPMIKQHRLVNTELSEEIKGMHGLQIHTWAPSKFDKFPEEKQKEIFTAE